MSWLAEYIFRVSPRWLQNMLLTLLPLLASFATPSVSTGNFSIPYLNYYCNAAHVAAANWSAPPRSHGFTGSLKLVHVTALLRHHKRTPANLIPLENQFNPPGGWDCTEMGTLNFAVSPEFGHNSPLLVHQTELPDWHPFFPNFWNGTCQEGQLTPGGLADAIQHGKDFWSVYGKTSHHGLQTPLLTSVNAKDIYVRTSTEERTFHVAAGMLWGMDSRISLKNFPVHVQPSQIDSLVPGYSCPRADSIRNAYQSVPAWTDHLNQNADLKARLDAVFGTAGRSDWASWYDHFFDVLTSRLCNFQPLPCNAQGVCVTAEDATKVFDIGDFEYNYIWNAAENATTYNSLTFGVLFKELAMNMRAVIAGTEPFKMRLYSGHDGSMIRLASGLGLGKPQIDGRLRWPALGGEVIFEVWKQSEKHQKDKLFVRVLHEGAPVRSLEWVPSDAFAELLESNVPDNLFQACNS